MSSVVRIWLWPSSSMTTRGWTFSPSSNVAAVCRPSCRRTWRTPGLLQQPGPVVVVGLLVDRSTVGLGEDQVLVDPLGAGQHPAAGTLAAVQRGVPRVAPDRSAASPRCPADPLVTVAS